MLKRLADGLGSKALLQKDPMQKLIWEYGVLMDTEIKTKALQPMIGSDRSTFGLLKGQTSQEPMTELSYLYPDNPCLQREYDKFTTEILVPVVTQAQI